MCDKHNTQKFGLVKGRRTMVRVLKRTPQAGHGGRCCTHSDLMCGFELRDESGAVVGHCQTRPQPGMYYSSVS